MKSVTGVGYGAAVAPFINDMTYRAWGAVKSVERGDGLQEELAYNVRGLVVSDMVGSSGATYQYHNDGTVKFVDALTTDPNGIKDRAFSYDAVGRTASAYSGSEARNFVNNTSGGTPDGPYWRSYGYDAWGNSTGESGRYWSRDDGIFVSFDSTNRNPEWKYDAEGNLITRNEPPDPGSFLPFEPLKSTYDASGNEVGSSQTRTYNMADSGGLVTTQYSTAQTYDSDGQVTNYTLSRSVSLNGNHTGGSSVTAFYLRSTVLAGQAISEYDAVGWRKSYVYANGERIGQQEEGGNGMARSTWHHADPVTGDSLDTVNGATVYQTTLDPRGVNLGDSDPFPANGSGDLDGIPDGASSPFSKNAEPLPIEGGGTRCVIDGLEQFCPFVGMNEASLACPNNDCGARAVTVTARTSGGKVVGSSSFWRFAGQLGWDGSLDGTYDVNSTWASRFAFGTAGGAQSFLTLVKYGDEIFGSSASELFHRRSGGFSSQAQASNIVAAAYVTPQHPGQRQQPKADPKEPCDVTGFENAIGRYSASELNDAALTVFGEMGARLHYESFLEARAIASEIFNRSEAIADGKKGNNPWGKTSSLSDVVSAPTQFIGYQEGIDLATHDVDFKSGERNCIRMQFAIGAVTELASVRKEGLPAPYPFLFNFSNYGGRRPLDPGEVRIGGNDFSANPMKRYP